MIGSARPGPSAIARVGAVLLLCAATLLAAGFAPAAAHMRADPFTFGNPGFCTPRKVVRNLNRARPAARLRLSKSTVAPGQRVLSRVESLGTETVVFGEAFYVQRLQGGEWVAVPDATQGVWFDWLGWARPGASGRCSAWRIPTGFPPGRYRIVKRVGLGHRARRTAGRYLAAPIRVTDASTDSLRRPERSPGRG